MMSADIAGLATARRHVAGPRTAEHCRFLATAHFSALNGLRAVSVIAVVWHHTGGRAHPDGALGRGFLGVDFFFAISGFLITTLLLRERRATGSVSLRRFYVRRSLRIFPLYYAVLALYVVLTVLTRRHTAEGQAFLDHLPAFLTYTSNWFVDWKADVGVTFYFAWSLATEEQFYLLWPPVLVWLLARGRGPVLAPALALSVAAATSLFAAHVVGPETLGWRILGSLALPILAAALGAVLLDDERWFRWLAPVLGAVGTAPALTAALLVLIVALPQRELVQLTMVLVVMSCCVRDNPFLTPVLTFFPAVWIGTVSYGVYLLHMLASNALRPWLGSYAVPDFLATLMLAVAMASVSYLLFERRILAYKARFAAPAAAPAQPQPDPRHSGGAS